MEFQKTAHSVVIPRCETCNGRFKPKTKVSCVDCNCKIHYDCAVYADEIGNDMLCLNCYKNEKIRQGLENDGIIVKVEGNDLCRVYKGKSFWGDDSKIMIGEDLRNDEFLAEVEPFESSDFIKKCGELSEIYNKPICAYGYCEEKLYNRGKLPNWRDMWICNECNSDVKYLEELDKLKKKYNKM
jgi:hypothetical protein